MAERDSRPGRAARAGAWLRTLSGVLRSTRRRYVTAAAGLIALTLIITLAAWVGVHLPAAATSASAPAVGHPRPSPATGPAAEAEKPLAGQPDSEAPPGSAVHADDGPPVADEQPPGATVEPPLPPSAPPTASMTVRFRPSTRWDGGMVGYFAITNTTGTPVTGWRLVITVPADLVVTATWEAKMRRVGNTITFTPTRTSARVDVGTTVRFGLQATAKRGYNLPLTCLINDAQCA
jgi:endoglucanase